MNTTRTEASADFLELRSVEERIKQATELILRRKEEICAPLLVGRSWIPLETVKRPVRSIIMSLLAPQVAGTTFGMLVWGNKILLSTAGEFNTKSSPSPIGFWLWISCRDFQFLWSVNSSLRKFTFLREVKLCVKYWDLTCNFCPHVPDFTTPLIICNGTRDQTGSLLLTLDPCDTTDPWPLTQQFSWKKSKLLQAGQATVAGFKKTEISLTRSISIRVI